MKKNVGTPDRFIRGAMAIMLLAAFFLAPLDLPWRLAMLAGAAIMLMTALAGSCPIYHMLGLSSCKVPKH